MLNLCFARAKRRLSFGLSFLALAVLAAACLPATNPFDPNTPLALQARGSVSGDLLLAYATPVESVVGARLDALAVLLTNVGSESEDVVVTRVTCAEALLCDPAAGTASFNFSDLAPGSYRLAIDNPPAGLLDPTGGRSLLIELLAGEDYLEPTLTFSEPPRDANDEGEGAIGGVVQLEGGAASPDVVAYQLVGNSLFERARTPTIADGSFNLQGLPAGDYVVSAKATGFTPDYSTVVSVLDDEEFLDEALVLFPGTAVVNPDLQQSFGEFYTRASELPVQVLAFGGMTEMRVWTSGEPPDFVPYSAATTVALPDQQGAIVVNAQFRRTTEDGFTFLTDVFTAEVVRDTVQPDIIDAAIVGKVAASDGNVYALLAGETISVEIAANDVTTAIFGVKLLESADGFAPNPNDLDFPELFAPSGYVEVQDSEALSEGEGLKTFFVFVRDRAGNFSEGEEVTITLDTIAPILGDAGAGVAPIEVLGATIDGRLQSHLPTVRVVLGAGVDDVAALAIGEAPLATDAPRGAFSLDSQVPVSASDGQSVAFTARVWDFAGNQTEVSTLELTLDFTGSIVGQALLDEEAAGSLVHAGTVVSIWAQGKNPDLDPNDGTTLTADDGSFALSGVPEGSNLRIRYQRPGADLIEGLVSEVIAGEVVSLPTVLLPVSRGNIVGVFQRQDVGDPTGHGAILVEAVYGGAVYATTVTEAGGSYRFPFPGLPVTIGTGRYTVRASTESYLPASQTAIQVAADTDTVVLPDGNTPPAAQPVLLLPQSGDFALCAATGPCLATQYTNQVSVRIAIPGDDSDVTDVRYQARTAFVDADATPAWAGTYTPGADLLVDLSGSDGAVDVFLQLERSGIPGIVLRTTIVLDRIAPTVDSVVITNGPAASLAGFTNVAGLAVTITADQGAADSSPLQQHFVVIADADPMAIPTNAASCAVAGVCALVLPDTAGVVDEKRHTLWAYACDVAGNCSSTGVSGDIVFDRTLPSALNGAAFTATGALVSSLGGVTYTGARDFQIDLELGAAEDAASNPVLDLDGDAVADVVAYRFKTVYVGAGVGPTTTSFDGIAWNEASGPLPLATIAGLAAPSLLGGEGSYRLFAQMRDGAGNRSALDPNPFFVDVTLDTEGPGALFEVVAPSGFTTSTTVSLRVLAAANDPVVGLLVALDGGLFQSVVNFPITMLSETVSFDLSTLTSFAGDGEYELTARLTDAAGNRAVKSASVILDTSPPEPRIISCSSCTSSSGTLYSGALTLLFDVLAEDALGLVTDVNVVVDGMVNSTAPYDGTLSVPIPGAPDPQGVHTIAITFLDEAGNESPVPGVGQTIDVIYDSVIAPPSLVINGGASFSTDALGQVALSITADLDVVEMRLGNNGALGAWQPFNSNLAWTLLQPTVEGSKTVDLEVRDGAGNVESDSASVQLDLADPVGTVTIDSGASYATGLSVTLALAHPNDVNRVVIANGPTVDCAGASGQQAITLGTTSTSGLAHALDAGEGQKYVSVCFEDQAGRTFVATAAITLDTESPQGTVSIENDALFTQTAAVDVYITASSDIANVALGDGTLDCAAVVTWLSFDAVKQTVLSAPDGLKVVKVCFRDQAGLISEAQDDISLDTSDPGGTIEINAGADYTTTTSVTLTFNAPADTTGYAVTDGTTLDCDTASYSFFAGVVPYTLPAIDGPLSVTVCFEDAAGRKDTNTDAIILDRSAPAGAISLAAGDAFTVSPTVAVSLTHPSDATGYALAEGLLDCELATYVAATGTSTNTAFVLSAVEGVKTVSACFQDAAGLTAGTSDDIVYDNTPAAFDVSINAGAAFSTSRTVTLTYATSDTAEYVVGSPPPACFDPATVYDPYSVSSESFQLPDIDGSHQVGVCFKDAAGNPDFVEANITLDRGLPSVTAVSINSGALHTSTTGITVEITAQDSPLVSGVIEMQVSEDATFAGVGWVPINPTLGYVLSSENETKTVYVRVRDAAGNVSLTAGSADEDSINLDTERPTLTIFTHATGFTNVTGISMQVDADDNIDSTTQLEVKIGVNDPTPCGGVFVPLTAIVVGDLPPTTGPHTVSACVRDRAGNVGFFQSTIVVFDPDAPNLVPPPTLVGGSRQFTVAWVDTRDFDVPGQGSGVAGWEIEADPSPSFLTPQLFTSSVTSVTVGETKNGVEYWARVRAVDRAGNRGPWSSATSVLPGFSGVTTPGSFAISNPDEANPTVLYANGVLYTALIDSSGGAMPGGQSIVLKQCPIANVDCRQPSSWSTFNFNEQGFAASANVNGKRTPMVHFAGRLWVAGLYAGAFEQVVLLHTCRDTQDCSVVANWNEAVVQSAANVDLTVLGLGAGGTHLAVAWSENTDELRIASCAPNANDCDDPSDFVGVFVDNIAQNDDAMVEIAAAERSLAAIYRYDSTSVHLARCDQIDRCNSASDWTTFNVAALTGDGPNPIYSNPSLDAVDGFLYASWRRRTGFSPPYSYTYPTSRCDIIYDCSLPALWSTSANVFPATGPFDQVHLRAGIKSLYASWWNGALGATQLGICDIAGAGNGDPADGGACTDLVNWRFLVVDDVVNLETEAFVTEVGPAPVVTYLSGLSIKVALPIISSPLEHVVVAGVGTLKQTWAPLYQQSGYQQVFGGTPPAFSNVISLGDPSLESTTLALPPGTETAVSLRAVNAVGQVSDDALGFTVAPHTLGNTDVSDVLMNSVRCSGFSPACAVAGSDAEAGYLVTAYARDFANGIAVAVCDTNINPSCASGGDYVLVSLGSFGAPVDGVEVELATGSDGAVWAFVLFHGGPNAQGFVCNLTATGCDEEFEWALTATMSNLSTALLPRIVFARDVSGPDLLFVAYRGETSRLELAECEVAGCGAWTTRSPATALPVSDAGLAVTNSNVYVTVAARHVSGALMIKRFDKTDNTFDSNRTVSSAFFFDYDQIAVASGGRQAIATVSSGRLKVFVCPSSMNLCSAPANWASVDLGEMPGNDGLGVDVAVSNAGQVTVASVSSREVRLSWCNKDCGHNKNWVYPASVFRDQRFRPYASNASFLNKNAVGAIALGVARDDPASGMLLTLFGGKNEGPFLNK